MATQRIDGMKYSFERLSTDDLEGIHGYLILQHQRITEDIVTVEGELHRRHNPELPFEDSLRNYERAIGHAVMTGEINCFEAIEALEAYENGRNEQTV